MSRKAIRTLAAVLTGLAATAAAGEGPAGRFFAQAPDSFLLTVPKTSRLDMLDYYRFGSDRPTSDAFTADARVVAESPACITVEVGHTRRQLAVLPAGGDTLLAVVTTVSLPARASSVELFRKDFTPAPQNPLGKVGRYSDWFVAGAFDSVPDLELILPFVPAEAEFDSTATRLTLRNNAEQYLTAADYARLRPLMLDSLTYDVARGRFRLRTGR